MQKQTYPIPKAADRYTDIGSLGRWLPEPWQPYGQLLRLDRPAGYWLLLLPGWFAILLGSPALGWQTLGYLLLFFLGGVALRGAGCVINDLWDRDLDRRVERTADRPLASGRISGRRALALFIALVLLGVLVLAFLPWRVWIWAAGSLPLIVIYPLAKRYLPTPQVVLGLTFSWGALLGWLSVQSALGFAAFFLYLGTFFWILYYDTIYATQDREDDRRMGLNSMPLFLGDSLEQGLTLFALITLGLWATALAFAGAGIFAWLGLILVAGRFYQQLERFDSSSPAMCLTQFKANVGIGQLWCLFLALGLIF